MTAPVYLREMWPFFLLSEAGEPTPGTTNTLDLMLPAKPADFRALLLPILERTNPSAAPALTSMPDKELRFWILALREARPQGDLLMTPAWLTQNGRVMQGLARVVALEFHERMDVFLHALHARAAA